MKFLNKIQNNSLAILILLIFNFALSNHAVAQSCNQVDILFTAPDCSSGKNAAGSQERGCKEASACVNQTYNYASSLTGTGWTYNWNVTGPTSVSINPNNTSPSISISWPQAGAYTLNLTVTDASGNSFTKCLTVTVLERPNANFNISATTACTGSTITFTGTTTYSGSFVSSWNFADPLSGSNNFITTPGNGAVTHVFNNVGTYDVTLITSSVSIVTVPGPDGQKNTVIRTCCADTIKKRVIITQGNISIDCISTVCAGSTATYTINGCANPTVTLVGASSFTQSGNQVTVVWGNGSVQGQMNVSCPGGCTSSSPVPIIPSTPIITGNTSPCNSGSSIYSLPVLPGTFYTWTLLNTTTSTNYDGNINTYPDNNTVIINWAFLPAGTYQLGVTLNNKHICCTSSGSLTITPSGTWKAYYDQTVCKGTAANLSATGATGAVYNWTVLPPNAGVVPLTSSPASSFNPVFSNIGTYNVQVTETANQFCNSGASNPQIVKVTVIDVPVPGTITGPNKGCPGSVYNYAMSTPAPAGFHYEWTITTGAGVFLPTVSPPVSGDNVSIKWTTLPAQISIILKSNGYPTCVAPAVTLSISQAAMGTITGANNVCVDAEEIYTIAGGSLPAGEMITWSLSPSSLGSIIAGPGTSSPKIKWHGTTGSGPWSAILTASSNCGVANYTISIGKPPIATLSQSGNICIGAGTTLTATPGYTYSWSNGASTNTTNVTAAGMYSVVISNGTCTINKTIEVKDPFAILPASCGVGFCNGTSTNEQLGVSVIRPGSGTFTYEWHQGVYPAGPIVASTAASTSMSNNYLATTPGNYWVKVTYGNCFKWAPFTVQKVCCPNVPNPVISSVVRNSCTQFQFTGSTTGGVPFTWDFGDGTTEAGTSGGTKTHNYTHAGVYCVKICVAPPTPNPTACAGNCAATSVIVPIEPAFTYKLGCNGCLLIENNSIVIPTSSSATWTYTWNFGNGPSSIFTTSSPVPPSYCYTAAGTYSATLTINYNDATIAPPAGGLVCSATTTPITITYAPLDFTTVPSPVCSQTPTTFTSVPNTYNNYAWEFGDTYTSYASPTQHSYSAVTTPTTKTVKLTVVDELGNTCIKTKPITINPGIANCVILPAFICPGGSAVLNAPTGTFSSYQWQVQSGSGFANAPGTSTNANYSTTTAGFYRVIVSNSYGCTCTSNTVEVKNVSKPKALIEASTTRLCGQGYVMLSSVNHAPGYTSDWYASTWGAPLQTSQYYNANVTASSTFYLVLTNQYGCKDTCQVSIEVNPIPAEPIITSSSTTMCEGVPITLSVTNYSTNLAWNNGANTGSITVVAAGAYTATYTNPVTGCSSSKTIVVKKRPSTELFPHFCDSIKCTCRNADGSFTVYAPKPLTGLFASTYNIAWLYNGNVMAANANNPAYTPAATGSYQVILTDAANGCKDTSNVYSIVVPPCVDTTNCCTGSVWQQQPYYQFGTTGKPERIDCTSETVVIIRGDLCKIPLIVAAKIKCASEKCTSADSVFVYNSSNVLVQKGTAPFSITGLGNDTYTVVVNGYCGGLLCLTCKLTVKVDCKEKPCDCKGSNWGEMYFAPSVASANVKATPIKCDGIYKLNCKQAYDINAFYNCVGKDCPGRVEYKLQAPDASIVTGTMPLVAFTPTQSGTYVLLLQGYCGDVLCNKCKITFRVECPVDSNCCPYNISVRHTAPTYTSNTTSTNVNTNYSITLPAAANIKEVRAEVMSYTITDNFGKECMKCVNLPFTWASTASATNIGTAAPKITVYGGTGIPVFTGTGAGAYQNPREIIWNNGSNLNGGSGISNIGINFILPPTPAIDCCELSGKICVKFVFRDNDCKECEVIECFDFVIKKK